MAERIYKSVNGVGHRITSPPRGPPPRLHGGGYRAFAPEATSRLSRYVALVQKPVNPLHRGGGAGGSEGFWMEHISC